VQGNKPFLWCGLQWSLNFNEKLFPSLELVVLPSVPFLIKVKCNATEKYSTGYSQELQERTLIPWITLSFSSTKKHLYIKDSPIASAPKSSITFNFEMVITEQPKPNYNNMF